MLMPFDPIPSGNLVQGNNQEETQHFHFKYISSGMLIIENKTRRYLTT